MDKPAIDNLADPTKPEIYYFDDNVREQVLAKQAAQPTEPTPKKTTARKTTKKR